MAVGVIGLLVAALVIWRYQTRDTAAGLLSLRYQEITLVERMQADLSRASDAEKSAVMAVTDEESQTFADQSRAASAAVEQERGEFGRLLDSHNDAAERKYFSEFSQAFLEYQAVDAELLDLAVKNTNLKAYSLAFGPAAQSIHEMDQALSRLIAAKSASPESRRVTRLAAEADIGALRIEAMLPAHISAESYQKMDAMESAMAAEDRQVKERFAELAQLTGPAERGELQTAVESYRKFGELRTQIIALSRENTNVRSLTISLNRKRLIDLKCQNALTALEQAIQSKRVPEVPPSPR